MANRALYIILYLCVSFNIYAHCGPKALPTCPGDGGVMAENGNYAEDYLYENFKKMYSCEDREKLADPDKTSEAYKDDIEDLFDEIEDEEHCIDLTGIINEYRLDLSKNKERHGKVYKSYMQRFREPIDQGEAFIWGEGWDWCSAANSSWKSIAFMDLIEDLEDIKVSGAPETIIENNGVAQSCKNVRVSGNADLNSFFVKTEDSADGKIIMEYNTYSVADQIKVTAKDSVLMDSGCTGTQKERVEFISVPSVAEDSKVKIEIDASCQGSGDTAWTIHITCNSKVSEEKKTHYSPSCNSKLSELKQTVKAAIENEKKILDKFWMDAMCNGDVTKKFLTLQQIKHLNFGKHILKVGTSYSSQKNASRKLTVSNLLGAFEVKEQAAIITSMSRLKASLKDRDKEKDCLAQKDANKNIFTKISRVYCSVGYERLLGKDGFIQVDDLTDRGSYIERDLNEGRPSISEGSQKDLENRSTASVSRYDLKEDPATSNKLRILKNHLRYMDKDKECQSGEDTNNNIFNRISRMYCRVGFERLLGTD